MFILGAFMQILKFIYRMWPNWVQSITSRFPDPRIKAKCTFSMEQIIFSGLMVFLLRYRSLRAFHFEHKDNPTSLKNFQKWISINEIPSDDQLRYCLQTIPTVDLNNFLKDLHRQIDRSKILYKQRLFNRHDLITLDGTGQISSSNICCEKCLTKTLANEEVCFYHGQLLASLTNCKASYSLPLQFEPIERSDTETQYSKNDCELNAAKRLLTKLKTQFPKRNFCILADNLFGVDPILNLILDRQWSFVITAKPDRNKELFFMFDYLKERKQSHTVTDKDGTTHHYQWSRQLPLKQYTKNEKPIFVNLILYEEINPDGEITFNSAWMTNIEITADNIRKLALAGRARFAIENRNFNEQKNLGFQTEHNFGHFGNLPNVFFGFVQIAQLITELYRFWRQGSMAITKVGSKRRYFERLAVIVSTIILPDDNLNWPLYLKFDFNST
jgi:hypothetical protein